MALFFHHGNNNSIFDPFQAFSVFSDSEQSQQLAREASAVANTRVDWLETPESHVFKADLPGLSKEEIKIQVEDGRTLHISGERKKESAHKDAKWHRVERAHGSFTRKFRLPENANVEGIKAEVANGILTIAIPKIPKPQPRTIAVEWNENVSGSDGVKVGNSDDGKISGSDGNNLRGSDGVVSSDADKTSVLDGNNHPGSGPDGRKVSEHDASEVSGSDEKVSTPDGN